MILTILVRFYRHINEYKRKTDSQVQMFEIIQDIDNCPVSTRVVLICCCAKFFCGQAFTSGFIMVQLR